MFRKDIDRLLRTDHQEQIPRLKAQCLLIGLLPKTQCEPVTDPEDPFFTEALMLASLL